MPEGFITVSQAAALKGVSRAAIYTAVKTGRLPHTILLERIGLSEADVRAWEPVAYAGRPGAEGRGGRKAGGTVSAETRARLSEKAKELWEKRRAAGKEGEAGQ